MLFYLVLAQFDKFGGTEDTDILSTPMLKDELAILKDSLQDIVPLNYVATLMSEPINYGYTLSLIHI